MDDGREEDGEERSVGKGSRVKLKHKGEGGDRGEEGAAGRKVKMFEEKERRRAWKRGRRKTREGAGGRRRGSGGPR